MYRKQLFWQKVLCFAAIAACGLLFIYALGLSTDLFDGLFYALPEEAKIKTAAETGKVIKLNVPGAEVYYEIQPFNRTLLDGAIGLMLLGVLLFITNTHARRRYYISNALSTAAFVSGGIALSIYAHQQIEAYKQKFLMIDFDAYQKFANRRKKPFLDSTFWFDAHYLLFALLLLVCLALVLNFIWKMHLMRAEKRLIDAGKGEK